MAAYWANRRLERLIPEVHMMCSEAKKKCIYAVSKELGIDIDWDGLDHLSDKEASDCIDELKAQLKNKPGQPETFEPVINDARLGMCYKLVFRSAVPSYWREHKEVFKRELVAAYILATEAEEAVKSALSASAVKVRCDICHNNTIHPVSLDNDSRTICKVCAEKIRKDNKLDSEPVEDVTIPMGA